MLLLGIFKNTNGKIENNLYYDWNEWHKDTFSPKTKIQTMILFKVGGKTYTEKKENLRDLAIKFSNNVGKTCLSYGELAEINYFFEKNGKRYGLLKEFKENGVC